MKQLFKILLVSFLMTFNICHAQKMIQTIGDAKKLELNKDKFIGKPLKELLKEIRPEIKMVYGNPENIFNEFSTYISFYFVDKEEYRIRNIKGEHPTTIRVIFKQNKDNHPARPLEKPDVWKKEYEKLYGEMIIVDIRVSGSN